MFQYPIEMQTNNRSLLITTITDPPANRKAISQGSASSFRGSFRWNRCNGGTRIATVQSGEEKATYFAGWVIISLESSKRVVEAGSGVVAALVSLSLVVVVVCQPVIRFNLEFYFDLPPPLPPFFRIPLFNVSCPSTPLFDQWPVNDTISLLICRANLDLDTRSIFNLIRGQTRPFL